MLVSNPNGVNLHRGKILRYRFFKRVSNPNGVNLHFACRSFGLNFLVSNPNGVNLHGDFINTLFRACEFQTPTG